MIFWIKTPQLVIVQNPPSIPVLSFLYLFKLIKRKTKVIIDVHNYGYTLMYRTKSKKMLDFCRWYEQFFVRKVADHCLTVSEKMKQDILSNWKVKNVGPPHAGDRLLRQGEQRGLQGAIAARQTPVLRGQRRVHWEERPAHAVHHLEPDGGGRQAVRICGEQADPAADLHHLHRGRSSLSVTRKSSTCSTR